MQKKPEEDAKQEGQVVSESPIVPSTNETFPLSPLSAEERERKLHQLAEIARWLEKIMKDSGQFVEIGRDPITGKISVHVKLDGWELMAKFVGVKGVIERTELITIEEGGEQIWKARAIVTNQRGEVVSSAEGVCVVGELTRRRDGTAVKKFPTHHSALAMASTRALRIAYRNALRVILTLAGYEAVEIEGDEGENKPIPAPVENDPERDYLQALGITPPVARSLRNSLERLGLNRGEDFRQFIRMCREKGIKTVKGIMKEIKEMEAKKEKPKVPGAGKESIRDQRIEQVMDAVDPFEIGDRGGEEI